MKYPVGAAGMGFAAVVDVAVSPFFSLSHLVEELMADSGLMGLV